MMQEKCLLKKNHYLIMREAMAKYVLISSARRRLSSMWWTDTHHASYAIFLIFVGADSRAYIAQFLFFHMRMLTIIYRNDDDDT